MESGVQKGCKEGDTMTRTVEWLPQLHEPQVAADFLAVFPLTVAESNGRGYLTFSEAIQQGLVSVPETGQVSEIVVVVKGEKPVLIVEGEVIVGGWQNRTVNISLLLQPGKEHRIPVSCVERGRWHPRHSPFRPEPFFEPAPAKSAPSSAFEPAPFVAHAQLRLQKTASTLRTYRTWARPVADQQEVWAEVERKLLCASVESPTSDATAFYEHHHASVGELLQAFEPIPNQVGAIVALGHRLVGMDAFDHPETWQVLHRKILAGYAADALELLWLGKRSTPATLTDAEAFYRSVREALEEAIVQPSPVGLGEHHLLDKDGTKGFALVHDGAIRHLFAFPTSH